MANPTLVLWCDAAQNRLYKSWLSSQPLEQPQLKQGDSIFVEIHWLSSLGVNGIEEYKFSPSTNVILAIGLVDAYPTAGYFKLSYGSQTTGSLAYNITASDLEAALNELSSIASEGGVSVEKNGELYRIVWSEPGVRTNQLTANVDELAPSSDSAISELRAGTTTLSREIILGLKQSPIAACTSFSPLPEPAITVENVLPNAWRLTIAPTPRSGSYSISFVAGFTTYTTAAIPYNSTPGFIANALNKLLDVGSNQFSVNATGQNSIEINCPVATKINGTTVSIGAVTVESALIGFSGITGVLNMNTVQVEEFLAGEMTKNCYLEVEVEQDGMKQTIIQAPVTVMNDLISNSVFTLVDMGEVMPVDSVVRYDTSQSLTNGEKAQARLNIDASDTTTVAGLSNDVATLQGQLSSISYSVLTTDQKNAITGAATPSGTNVFITASAQTTSLATKADLVHTHTAVQITDSTTAGRALLTAADLAAQKTLLGITGGPFAPVASPTFTGTVTIPAGASITGYLTTTTAASTYAARASNLSDLSSVSAARTNLGLGTMALETASNYLTSSATASTYLTQANAASSYLAKADNLTGLANLSTARTNLGLGTSNSPQFTSTYFGGTSGNYSIASGNSLSTYATGGQYVTVQPSGITAQSSDGISVTVPANGDVAKVAKTGDYNGEYGIWYGSSTGSQTGLTKDGVRFKDGTLQTTAMTSDFNSTLTSLPGTSFTTYVSSGGTRRNIIDETTGNPTPVGGGAVTQIYAGGSEGAGQLKARVQTGEDWVRTIAGSTYLGDVFTFLTSTMFFSQREVKYQTRPSNEGAWTNDELNNITDNFIRMDKKWKMSYNVCVFSNLPDDAQSTWIPTIGSSGTYDSSTPVTNSAVIWFGTAGYMVGAGYGYAGYPLPSTSTSVSNGICLFFFNRAWGSLMFRYPKTQRGNASDPDIPNTYVIPVPGEVAVPGFDASCFMEANRTLCMDVEITNLASGTLNQDNSNTMKVKLTIYDANQLSTQVIEFEVNDVASPIEIPSPDGDILCGTDGYGTQVLAIGARADNKGFIKPYIDFQMSNIKFAYID